jgi:hypothetical protein
MRLSPLTVRVLAGVLFASGLVLLLVSTGLIGAREPGTVRSEKLDPAKLVESGAVPTDPALAPKPQQKLTLSRFALCEAPATGARAYRVTVAAAREALLVFCKGAFELYSLEQAGAGMRALRTARFATRAALPGGAAGGDFDGDGAFDLVIGAAPAHGVLHEAWAGAFWVRGRTQGGYEAPRALAETPTVAMVATDLDGTPPSDMLLLTRGDVAAQRKGELWAYTGGPLFARTRVVQSALDPRDLFVSELRDPAAPAVQALVVSGQPGAVVSVRFERGGAAPVVTSSPLPGAQAFVPGLLQAGKPFVRTPTHLYALAAEPGAQSQVWASEANVGPGVWSALDASGGARVIGALAHGLGEVRAGEKPLEDELFFGDAARVHDVLALADASGRARLFALVEEAGSLALLLVPELPWGTDVTPTFERGSVEDAQGFADVPLQ